MSLNILKKMIVFSTERTRKIIENIIADEAFVERRSASALIEKHLLNDLLPKNSSASSWLQLLYDGSWGIGDVLQACFSDLSAGVYWESKYDNALDLVKFSHHWDIMANNKPDPEAPEMYHYLSLFDSLVTKLDTIAKENVDGKFEAQTEADWARELYRISKEEPQFMRLCNTYQLIINNWTVLKNWSITYRILADLVAMQPDWRNTEETRYELKKILTAMSDEWDV